MHELNSTEILVMQSIFEGNNRLKDISENADKSIAQVSVTVKKLCEKGFLVKEKRGLSKIISFSSHDFAHNFKELLVRSFPVEECLSYSKMTILSFFLGPRVRISITDLKAKTDLSITTIRNALHNAIKFGVVRKIPYGYKLSNRMVLLKNFLNGYSEFISNKNIKSYATNGIIHWRVGFEFIYSLPKGVRESIGNPTSITAYTYDGIKIRSNRDYYHYSPTMKILKKEDFIIDHIILNHYGKGIFHKQNLIYSLIYLKRFYDEIDENYFIRLSRISGLSSIAKEFLSYFNEDYIGKKYLPSKKEFYEKYKLYR
jgi:predicted transcriptional regulator